MKTAVINIKTDPQVKANAQKVAQELGISLSSILNGYLRQLIKSKTVFFSTKHEQPSQYLRESLTQSARDIRKGRVSPAFETAEEAIKWLDDPNAPYENDPEVLRKLSEAIPKVSDEDTKSH